MVKIHFELKDYFFQLLKKTLFHDISKTEIDFH